MYMAGVCPLSFALSTRFHKSRDKCHRMSTNIRLLPKGPGFDLPPEGAYEDCQSFQSFSGVMARPGATCTEEPGGVVV